jgi:HEAT repeat protein
MSEENSTETLIAVAALRAVGSPDNIPFLEKVLEQSNHPKVRRNAMLVLARAAGPKALTLLQKRLLSDKETDQLSSALALARGNRQDHNNVLTEAIVNRALEDKTLSVVFGSAGGPTVLSNVMGSDISLEEKLRLLDLAGNSPALATPAVRIYLADEVAFLMNSEEPQLEVKAIQILGRLAVPDERFSDPLFDKLESADDLVREEAIHALGAYSTPRNHQRFLDLLWDNNEKVRRTAWMLAARWVNESDRPVLEAAKDHHDDLIREQAEIVLEHLWAKAEKPS